MNNFLTMMKGLDYSLRYTYKLMAGLSGCFLVLILMTMVLQMASRWVNINLLGVSEYAGYFMAASAFLMAPQALLTKAHIRMDIFLSKTTGMTHNIIISLCLLVGNGVAMYMAYYAVQSVYISHKFNDVSQGIDATPLWIPQLAMAIGLVFFSIAIMHLTITRIFLGDTSIEQNDGNH